MKKLACLLLILVAITVNAFADEIKFRDFEWGTGVDKIKPEIKKMGYMFFDSVNYLTRWGELDEILDIFYTSTSEEEVGWQGVGVELDGAATVAGYKATGINVFCAYSLDEQGNVVRDKTKGLLYRAEYSIEAADVVAAYEDLKGKLTSLYGECTEVSKEGYSGEAIERVAQWNGDNNTAVRLYGQMKNTDIKTKNFFEYIEIIYGKTDADDYLAKVEDAIKREELNSESNVYNNNDTSGL